MELVKSQDAPAVQQQPGPPAWFKQWANSYRREFKMSPQVQTFVLRWWRDLPEAMRVFLVTHSGADVQAVGLAWDAISPDDQNRLLVAARQAAADLKPASWL